MSYKTRKHIWPVSLVMSVAIIGALAAFIVLAGNPGATQAHPGDEDAHQAHCATLGPIDQAIHDNLNNPGDVDCADLSQEPEPSPEPTPPTIDEPAEATVTSDSTSASGSPEIQLSLVDIDMALDVGASIVVYLEDDFQEPDSIPASSVYLRVTYPKDKTTGNGGRVYVESGPKIKTSDYFDQDKKDISIRVLVPDMCDDDTTGCEGQDGIPMGADVTLVIESDSGIKNPSEARKPGYHTGYALLDASAAKIPGRGNFDQLDDLEIRAKISLSDVDNKRGYEMTVTGSGFNDGTSAGVYVLHYPDADNADKDTWPSCEMITDDGTNVGGALVGSDDKVSVTFEITAPTFSAGKDNYICMEDGEGRMSDTDVEDFNLEPSIKVVPSSVHTGDTVNVFAQDYSNDPAGFSQLMIAGEVISDVTGSGIRPDGSGTATFKVPGGYEGVLRIDAAWGPLDADDKCKAANGCIIKNSKITIAGAQLNVSKTEVLPNETITITGNGFGTGRNTCIDVDNITLDNVPVIVDPDSTANSGACDDMVEVSNSGQFVVTILMWGAGSNDANPVLIPGTHELRVEDNKEFSSSLNITIPEPTVMVTPDIAGPRDYITITGANWPVDNPDNSTVSPTVTIEVADGRTYSVFADAVGRVTQEHRVHRNVAIPSTVQVKASFGHVVKIGSFAVPASTITVTPGEGQPGDMVTLTAGNMKVYTAVDYVEIGGTRQENPGVNTDRDGNVTVEDVLIPGLDPGVYSVVINVDGTIAIGEINVLAESSAAGAPAELPGAVESLGDNLVAIFHFDDVGKEWSFYDPRPEFADLNTLTELVNGEAYWILVSESVEDVVLNNKVRSLTCRGDDCWNLEVW